MKATLKNTKTNHGTALQFTIGMMTMMALTIGLVGCVDETNGEGSGQLSSKKSAVSAIDHGDKSYRENSKSGRRDHKGIRGKHGRKGRKHRDPAGMLIKTALKQESLTAEQRATIEAIVAKKKEGRKEMRREGKQAFRSTLAQAVREGNLDANTMKAHFEERSKKREARAAARREALDTLYTTLDATQRQAVVADIKARFEKKRDGRKGSRKHGGKYGKGFGKGKRGEGHREKNEWAKGEGAHRKGKKGFRGKVGRHGGSVFRLVKELDLTEEQQAQIAELKQSQRANRPDKAQREEKREAMKQCRASFLESLATDNFDATAARCNKGTDEDKTAKMNQRLAGFNSLMGILTEDQRNQLAERIENPPKRGDKARRI
jgi:Spy/CpxP family protein refolding chaperone